MIIWIDAQLSPVISKWINKEFSIDCSHVFEIGLLNASDEEIFFKAREKKVIVMTKDIDFVNLLEKNGPPPKIIWITIGNSSNNNFIKVLTNKLNKAIELLEHGESLIEISGSI